MIKLKCPQCKQKMAFPDEAAGKKGSCPNCGYKAVIPAPKKADNGPGQSATPRPGGATPAKPTAGRSEESPESGALADLQSALGGGKKPSSGPPRQRPAEAKTPAPPARKPPAPTPKPAAAGGEAPKATPPKPQPTAKPDQPAAARPAQPEAQQPKPPQTPRRPARAGGQRPAEGGGTKAPQAKTPEPAQPKPPAPKPKAPAEPASARPAQSPPPQPRPPHTRRSAAKHHHASDPATKRPAPQQRQPQEEDPLAALQSLHQDHEKPGEPSPAAADLDLGNLVGPSEPANRPEAEAGSQEPPPAETPSARQRKAVKTQVKAKPARREPKPVNCRSCGAENPAKATRCKQCNDWVTDAAAEAAARREAQSQKRKQVASGIVGGAGMGLLVLVKGLAGGLSRLSRGVERSAVMGWLARLPLPVWPAVALLVMIVLSSL